MHALIALLVSLTLLLGCAKKEETAAFAPDHRAVPLESKAQAEKSTRHLAYEHTLRVDIAETKLGGLFTSIQTKCQELSTDACEVIESRISAGHTPYASLKLRIKPSGVPRVVALLNQSGSVVEQSTTAEDLAAPITDTQQRLALKSDYRAKLEALRNQAAHDIDALIKINRELSEVQAEIDALTGKNANLLRRVETEVININLSSERSRTFMQPISAAAADFGMNLSQGIATAVTAIPYILPWAVLITVCIWVFRRFWSKRRGGPTNT